MILTHIEYNKNKVLQNGGGTIAESQTRPDQHHGDMG